MCLFFIHPAYSGNLILMKYYMLMSFVQPAQKYVHSFQTLLFFNHGIAQRGVQFDLNEEPRRRHKIINFNKNLVGFFLVSGKSRNNHLPLVDRFEEGAVSKQKNIKKKVFLNDKIKIDFIYILYSSLKS